MKFVSFFFGQKLSYGQPGYVEIDFSLCLSLTACFFYAQRSPPRRTRPMSRFVSAGCSTMSRLN